MCLFKKKVKNVSPLVKLGSNQESDYVDLGLSVLWCKKNYGAEKEEDYGEYFDYDSFEKKINEAGGVRVADKKEWIEALKNCKFEWIKKRNGFEMTGPNGNKIFFPLSCEGKGNYDKSMPGCYFWLSTGTSDGKYQYFGNVYMTSRYSKTCNHTISSTGRIDGFWISIRPVLAK